MLTPFKAWKAELERTQGMLLESERISAIGQMASGLVQEVKNPLTLVSQMIDYLDRTVLGSEAIPRADSEIARRLDAMAKGEIYDKRTRSRLRLAF